MAHADVQVSSVGHTCTSGGTAWDNAYMPTLSSASQNLCVLCACRPQKGHQMGSLAVLFESGLSVERGKRLCGVRQYCQARHGISGHLSGNKAVRGVPHGGFVRQACVV